MMASNEWVSWTSDDGFPFADFPDGAPTGYLTCTWGTDPALATDNIIILGWSPIDTDAATAAQDSLLAEGYERIDAPEGVYLALRDGTGAGDVEGFADAYLFTTDDVRWAMYKDQLRFVKAPDQPAA